MIKKSFSTIAFATLFVLLSFSEVRAQCGDELMDACHSHLGDARYIRSFPVQHSAQRRDPASEVSKYYVVLNSGTKYKIFACNDETKPGEVIFSLYRGGQLIATSYSYESEKHFPFIKYTCNMSGKYNLRFSFKDGKKGCAVGVLSITD